MATVEIDLTILYSVVVALVTCVSFLFKWGFDTVNKQINDLKTSALEDNKRCEENAKRYEENAKVANQLIADLQKQLVECFYKLGLLEGRNGVHEHNFIEADVPHASIGTNRK